MPSDFDKLGVERDLITREEWEARYPPVRERTDTELARIIVEVHRERKGGPAVVGAGHCVMCRRKWPCESFKLAAIVLDVTVARVPDAKDAHIQADYHAWQRANEAPTVYSEEP